MSDVSVLNLIADKDWDELLDRDPVEIATELSATLALIFGPVPQDLWDVIIAAGHVPCGEAGCKCELLRPQVLEGLSIARDDYREQVLTRGQS